ncbi:MAG: hypothetical protein ACAH59_06440 [Pseudobdellovibrionaceae bacterium]
MLIISFWLALASSFSVSVQAAEPSSVTCEYYESLEQEMTCGPEGYLQKWAYPMCQMYIKKAPKLSGSLQAWFPEIRFCLQAKLHEIKTELTCPNLEDLAIESHVSCYVETGFCNLSQSDQWKLMELINVNLFEPLWLETSARIVWACSATKHSPFESDFGAGPFHE